jgi:hypothetical protein
MILLGTSSRGYDIPSSLTEYPNPEDVLVCSLLRDQAMAAQTRVLDMDALSLHHHAGDCSRVVESPVSTAGARTTIDIREEALQVLRLEYPLVG